METEYSTIDFYKQLKEKYNKYLKPEITSIRMIQEFDEVLLEIREEHLTEGGFDKEIVKRSDLSFITDTDEDIAFFNIKDNIEINVLKFINDFSPYSIANTLDLFTDEATDKIFKKYNRFNVDE